MDLEARSRPCSVLFLPPYAQALAHRGEQVSIVLCGCTLHVFLIKLKNNLQCTVRAVHSHTISTDIITRLFAIDFTVLHDYMMLSATSYDTSRAERSERSDNQRQCMHSTSSAVGIALVAWSMVSCGCGLFWGELC